MAKFAKPEKQAASVMKCLQGKGNVLESVGTVRNYESALRVAAAWAKENRIEGGLRGMSVEDAVRFLQERSTEVGQKTIDLNRQALQCMMQNVTHKLEANERLEMVQGIPQQLSSRVYTPEQVQAIADHQQPLQCMMQNVTHKLEANERLEMVQGIPQQLSSRVYTPEQVQAIADHQQPHNGLATEIAYATGLRASELLTLRPIEDRTPDIRLRDGVDRTLETKFTGREDSVAYTVHGKGGLIREVRIPTALADRLEATRLPEPKVIQDRGINRETWYGIGGGNAWSASVTRTSEKLFGWSHGAHGLRHTYAQERMTELRQKGLQEETAKETVSQEVGHFRPDITDTYLR